jgi:hypothetical protein
METEGGPFDDACVGLGILILSVLNDGADAVIVKRNPDGNGWIVEEINESN